MRQPQNLVRPRANHSEVAYADAFSDSANRHTYAYPTSTTSPVPDPEGQYGSNAAFVTTSSYDFHSGRVTAATDANNQTTSFEYAANDIEGRANPSRRLTKVTRPDGGWTGYGYNEQAGSLYILTRTAQSATQSIDAYQYLDGLGRPHRSYLQEGGSYSVTDSEYDLLGRIWRVSNPYRTTTLNGEINPAGVWTTTSYDALGRVLTVTTPDAAVVTTSYSGNTVTVTDQMGKAHQRDGRLGPLAECHRSAD